MAAAAFCYADTVVFIPARTVDGNLDSRARMEAVHSEMRRQCGTAPGSARCQRLKRELQQEARNLQKQRRK
jgi:hypothetical protein